MSDRSLKDLFETLMNHVVEPCQALYGRRLVSLVVFGSVGRGVPCPNSDLDLLIVADDLPCGRMARADEFRSVEKVLGRYLSEIPQGGFSPEISPVFKTPAEAEQGSPLFLDMVEDARILYDRKCFMEHLLAGLKDRLNALGARRVRRANAWFWDLKPDYRPGDVFEL